MFRSLILGPSSVHFCEPGGEAFTTPKLFEAAVRELAPQIEHEVITEYLTYGERMASVAVQMVEKHSADAVFVMVGTNRLEDRYVVYTIRRRWPKLYRPAMKFAIKLKAASGGGTHGGAGARGLLFRIPRAMARVVIGSDNGYPMDLAIKYTKETIDALARFEDRGVAIHLLPTVRAKPSRDIQRRVETFTRELREQCSLRRVTLLSRFDYCREMGVTPQSTEQGTYPPRATREIDARAMTRFVLRTAEVGVWPAPPN